MQKKYQIILSIVGVLVVFIVVFEGIIAFRQQRQIAVLVKAFEDGGFSDFQKKDELKRLSEKATEDYNSKLIEERKQQYIASKKSISGIVSEINQDKILVDAKIVDINEINKADFSGDEKPLFRMVSKKYTVNITDKTKMEKKPAVGDLIGAVSDNSVLAVDSFDAIEIGITQTAEEIKKEQEEVAAVPVESANDVTKEVR